MYIHARTQNLCSFAISRATRQIFGVFLISESRPWDTRMMFWDNSFNLIKLYLYAQGSVFEVSFVFFRFRTYQNQNTGQKYSKSKEYTGYYPGAMVISTDHILFEYLLCRGTFREPRYVATECNDARKVCPRIFTI